jgi:hypothetical protein
MNRVKTASIAAIFCCYILTIGFDTVAQAQGRNEKLNKKAEHYALDNYAVYATDEMNVEKQKGFRDGVKVGRKYAKKLGVAPPDISTKYKRESSDYHEGFLRGFSAGYHERITIR